MRYTRASIAILSLSMFAASGCAASTQPQRHDTVPATASPSPSDWQTTGACGKERWPVKTGTDADAFRVGLGNITDTTVAALNAIPAPSINPLPQDSRIGPWEFTEYRVHATLTGYKMEADSDYHLILSDGGKTMIAEIPYPGCVSGGPLLSGIENARSEFDNQFQQNHDFGYTPTAALAQSFSSVSVPVTVTGIGFFDFKHGQDGVADNAFELHPVQDITFGS